MHLKSFLVWKIAPEDVSIHIVAGEKLLHVFNQKMQERAGKILERVGVQIHSGVRVTAVNDNEVILSDGSKINSKLVIWTAGIKPNVPSIDIPISNTKSRGRIVVDKTLEVIGADHIYALGDVATFADEFLPYSCPTRCTRSSRCGKKIL